MSKLQTSWSNGVDFEGLNENDRKQIKKVGFDKWLEENSKKKKPKVSPPSAAKSIATITGAPVATGAKAAFLEKKFTKAQKMAMAFIAAVSKEGIVTYAQAAKINPKYPADPAYYARKAGWEVTTDRKNKIFKVGKYVP